MIYKEIQMNKDQLQFNNNNQYYFIIEYRNNHLNNLNNIRVNN